ncbi:MAG: efflux RND transporter permease subunit [Gammaproteobacteria bacterium]|nr:efflux RND transporter permease subunit [Gammaproteobacteria bacterium]
MNLAGAGLAVRAINHPVGTIMITLAVVVLGVFAVERLSVNLLPHLIYPEVRVRILDPGVSATVMEERVTRQLEEQLAITEDAINVTSTTNEGGALVGLEFSYGKDIDIALRDASTRLDRAKRFLPASIDPPIIYKLDPSQIPAMEFVVTSRTRDPVSLRTWTDDVFAKWFLNLPGVAAAEVGGGLVREIHIRPDMKRLAGLGLTVDDLLAAIRNGNREEAAGRLTLPGLEYGSRTAGRVTTLEQLADLFLPLKSGGSIRLGEVAEVLDFHEDNRLRVRNNGVSGVKMTVQKQPDANTVAVADVVRKRLGWLRSNQLIPADVEVTNISDQSVYVRNSVGNASMAAVSGALLAMIVVYLFLGNLRRTLIIGSAIPISIFATFILMGLGNLTLNIMTLGGLALGIGMLVDNTIVMLENISRHQDAGESMLDAGRNGAGEVNSAIVASTSTNLAAVLPFLFISGLVGLLFRELIVTISAAIFASLIIALTLVPALAARVPASSHNRLRVFVDRRLKYLRDRYAALLERLIERPYPLLVAAVLALALPWWTFTSSQTEFLPRMDDGRVRINVSMDPGTPVDVMDVAVEQLEELVWSQGDVANVFTYVGGRIFGRTEREIANRSSLHLQLVPRSARQRSARQWVTDFQQNQRKQQRADMRVRAQAERIRGLRTSQSEEEISVRIQGPDLAVLARLADTVLERLQDTPGIRNLEHSLQDERQELAVEVDRERAAELGLSVADVGRMLRLALTGETAGDFLEGDRAFPIRVRLSPNDLQSPESLKSILLFGAREDRGPVYLGDVAQLGLVPVPSEIRRESQRRIVEVTASVTGTLGEAFSAVRGRLQSLELPVGYSLYYGGAEQSLEEGRSLGVGLLGLAIFLVFVVMAVQYESLRNPLVILVCIPFALIGVAAGLEILNLPVSMPVWLGLIMLAGIVVNNAIVLVEYIEILRRRGTMLSEAIIEAGRLRLRPILMTTLTTVIGMLPLALGWGEGAEMLQPLAIAIIWGLGFSMLVSLLLVPLVYRLLHAHDSVPVAASPHLPDGA